MKRILTGVVLGVIWLAILCSQSFYILWCVIVLLGGFALKEYFNICLTNSEKPLNPFAVSIGLLPILASFWADMNVTMASFLFSLLLSVVILFFVSKKVENPFIFMAKICAGSAFIGLCASHICLTMALEHGFKWLLMLSCITVASDTGAFYAGSTFGNNKLCPSISPGKTIEGFIGGIISSVIFACILGSFLFPGLPSNKTAFLAIIIATIGVVGDLAESILKRSNNIKDSGSILPGHGGLLDRIDSILATSPALYYAINFLNIS